MNQLRTVFLISIFAFVSVGCSLKVQDLTPLEQPTWANSGFLSDKTDALYYPQSTLDEINDANKELAHWVFIETKPQNVTDITSYVTVNGTEHQMQEYTGSSGKGLWVYRTDNMCNSEYSYHYRIRYKRGLYGYAIKRIGSTDAPLHSEVVEFGSAIWFERGGRPSSNRVGEVTFLSESPIPGYEPREKQIFIQRLVPGGNPHRISFVGLPHDETKFEIFERPPTTQELSCGDYAVVGVRWNPTPGDLHDDSTLVLIYQIYHDGRWVDSTPEFRITLKGRPYEPPP